MITLHRLSHTHDELHVNPDLIERCVACPDTVLTLTTGKTVLVSETPAEVAEAIRKWRVLLMLGARAC